MKCTSLYILFKEMNGGRAFAYNVIISRSIPKFFPLRPYQMWNDIMKMVSCVQNTIIAYYHANSHSNYIQLVDKIIKSSKYQTKRIIIPRKFLSFIDCDQRTDIKKKGKKEKKDSTNRIQLVKIFDTPFKILKY